MVNRGSARKDKLIASFYLDILFIGVYLPAFYPIRFNWWQQIDGIVNVQKIIFLYPIPGYEQIRNHIK